MDREGYKSARTHKPDIIVTDALMPEVDGFTMLRNIKKDPSTHHIPCVFYSSIYTGSKDRELALSLGAEAFISKPKRPEDVWKEIKPILKRKKQSEAGIDKKLITDEKEFLKSYSSVVTAKLEEKVKELENDVAKRNMAEDVLRKSDTMFKGIFDFNSDTILIVNRNGHIVQVNKAVETMFGYNYGELLYKPIEVLLPERYRERHVEYRNSYLSNPIVRPMGMCRNLYARRKDGSELPVDVMLSPVDIREGILVLGVVRDISEHKRTEAEVKRLFSAIDQSINSVFIADNTGRIEYVNSAFEHITGYSREEATGQNPRILASGETPHAVYEEQWQTILAGKTWRGIFKNKRKNGQYYWGNGLISPISDEKGRITHFLAIQEDITEKMRSEERLEYLATYDETTGCFNRAHFMTLLDEWISHNKTGTEKGVLLLINIDKFRLINDTYGTATGDIIIRHIGEFLQKTVTEVNGSFLNNATEGNIIGRMGGDEFVIFFSSVDKEKGIAVAEKIRKCLEKHRFIEIESHLTASIGIVIYPNHGITSQELLKKADAAVYHAKELGQNRAHVYHPEDLVLEKMRSRIEWKGRIQRAVEEYRFEPWFQPILDIKDNCVHHYEALARKRDKTGNIILPGLFIDTAETLGLVTAIDRIIIEKTLQIQSNLYKQGSSFSFSANLSGKDIGNEDLLEYLKAMIIETGANPKHLIFEITETAAVREINSAIKFIDKLRALGCSFSLDDFGVGFTSFKYLKEMKVDYIKIDGSFIRKLHTDQNDRLFVRAMVDVARGMGIKTIAEFVEHGETLKILRDYGVDYAQGYLIGKPAPDIIIS